MRLFVADCKDIYFYKNWDLKKPVILSQCGFIRGMKIKGVL